MFRSDYICPIVEPEKVLTFSLTAIWNSGFDKWTYNYAILGQGTHEVSVAGYLAENNENIRGPGQLVQAFPDNAPGHQTASNVAAPYQRVGCQPTIVYYPADQRDLSSLGTKISQMKPNWFMPGLGKVEDMGLISGAVYDAGYRGKFFHFLTSDIGLLAPVFKPEVLEGYICALAAMEVTPATTPYAQEIKDAWIAKYGKWDYPDYMTTPMYNSMVAAMAESRFS
jgi:ABC-type branched-subunit amino acid transport system substrate-binding protein